LPALAIAAQPPKGKGKAEPPPEDVVEAAPASLEPTSGEGEFSFADGSTYNGAWARVPETGLIVREARGVLTHVGIGYKYVGEWRDDRMHGYGARTRVRTRAS
jgi:hypothetical protein